MKAPRLWMAAVLLMVSGCSNHWSLWGNPDYGGYGYGEARLHRYDSEFGAGTFALGLECRGDYANDPSVVFFVTGAPNFSGNAMVVLAWDDQEPANQTWKVKYGLTAAFAASPDWYWVYPPNPESRRSFLARLVRSEHLSVEIAGPFSDYVQVPRGQFKTTGTSRVLDDLAKYCTRVP